MRRFRRRIAILVLSSALAAAALLGLSRSPAHADSGFCGVRVQGPTMISGELLWAYTWRNKCTITVHEALYFPSIGHSTGCYTLYPYAYMTAFVGTADPNWIIVNC